MTGNETTSAVPNPGSDEARHQGCTCPVIDNHRGKGWHGMPGCFVYTAGCPLHWPVGTELGQFKAVEARHAD